MNSLNQNNKENLESVGGSAKPLTTTTTTTPAPSAALSFRERLEQQLKKAKELQKQAQIDLEVTKKDSVKKDDPVVSQVPTSATVTTTTSTVTSSLPSAPAPSLTSSFSSRFSSILQRDQTKPLNTSSESSTLGSTKTESENKFSSISARLSQLRESINTSQSSIRPVTSTTFTSSYLRESKSEIKDSNALDSNKSEIKPSFLSSIYKETNKEKDTIQVPKKDDTQDCIIVEEKSTLKPKQTEVEMCIEIEANPKEIVSSQKKSSLPKSDFKTDSSNLIKINDNGIEESTKMKEENKIETQKESQSIIKEDSKLGNSNINGSNSRIFSSSLLASRSSLLTLDSSITTPSSLAQDNKDINQSQITTSSNLQQSVETYSTQNLFQKVDLIEDKKLTSNQTQIIAPIPQPQTVLQELSSKKAPTEIIKIIDNLPSSDSDLSQPNSQATQNDKQDVKSNIIKEDEAKIIEENQESTLNKQQFDQIGDKQIAEDDKVKQDSHIQEEQLQQQATENQDKMEIEEDKDKQAEENIQQQKPQIQNIEIEEIEQECTQEVKEDILQHPIVQENQQEIEQIQNKQEEQKIEIQEKLESSGQLSLSQIQQISTCQENNTLNLNSNSISGQIFADECQSTKDQLIQESNVNQIDQTVNQIENIQAPIQSQQNISKANTPEKQENNLEQNKAQTIQNDDKSSIDNNEAGKPIQNDQIDVQENLNQNQIEQEVQQSTSEIQQVQNEDNIKVDKSQEINVNEEKSQEINSNEDKLQEITINQDKPQEVTINEEKHQEIAISENKEEKIFQQDNGQNLIENDNITAQLLQEDQDRKLGEQELTCQQKINIENHEQQSEGKLSEKKSLEKISQILDQFEKMDEEDESHQSQSQQSQNIQELENLQNNVIDDQKQIEEQLPVITTIIEERKEQIQNENLVNQGQQIESKIDNQSEIINEIEIIEEKQEVIEAQQLVLNENKSAEKISNSNKSSSSKEKSLSSILSQIEECEKMEEEQFEDNNCQSSKEEQQLEEMEEQQMQIEEEIVKEEINMIQQDNNSPIQLQPQMIDQQVNEQPQTQIENQSVQEQSLVVQENQELKVEVEQCIQPEIVKSVMENNIENQLLHNEESNNSNHNNNQIEKQNQQEQVILNEQTQVQEKQIEEQNQPKNENEIRLALSKIVEDSSSSSASSSENNSQEAPMAENIQNEPQNQLLDDQNLLTTEEQPKDKYEVELTMKEETQIVQEAQETVNQEKIQIPEQKEQHEVQEFQCQQEIQEQIQVQENQITNENENHQNEIKNQETQAIEQQQTQTQQFEFIEQQNDVNQSVNKIESVHEIIEQENVTKEHEAIQDEQQIEVDQEQQMKQNDILKQDNSSIEEKPKQILQFTQIQQIELNQQKNEMADDDKNQENIQQIVEQIELETNHHEPQTEQNQVEQHIEVVQQQEIKQNDIEQKDDNTCKENNDYNEIQLHSEEQVESFAQEETKQIQVENLQENEDLQKKIQVSEQVQESNELESKELIQQQEQVDQTEIIQTNNNTNQENNYIDESQLNNQQLVQEETKQVLDDNVKVNEHIVQEIPEQVQESQELENKNMNQQLNQSIDQIQQSSQILHLPLNDQMQQQQQQNIENEESKMEEEQQQQQEDNNKELEINTEQQNQIEEHLNEKQTVFKSNDVQNNIQQQIIPTDTQIEQQEAMEIECETNIDELSQDHNDDLSHKDFELNNDNNTIEVVQEIVQNEQKQSSQKSLNEDQLEVNNEQNDLNNTSSPQQQQQIEITQDNQEDQQLSIQQEQQLETDNKEGELLSKSQTKDQSEQFDKGLIKCQSVEKELVKDERSIKSDVKVEDVSKIGNVMFDIDNYLKQKGFSEIKKVPSTQNNSEIKNLNGFNQLLSSKILSQSSLKNEQSSQDDYDHLITKKVEMDEILFSSQSQKKQKQQVEDLIGINNSVLSQMDKFLSEKSQKNSQSVSVSQNNLKKEGVHLNGNGSVAKSGDKSYPIDNSENIFERIKRESDKKNQENIELNSEQRNSLIVTNIFTPSNAKAVSISGGNQTQFSNDSFGITPKRINFLQSIKKNEDGMIINEEYQLQHSAIILNKQKESNEKRNAEVQQQEESGSQTSSNQNSFIQNNNNNINTKMVNSELKLRTPFNNQAIQQAEIDKKQVTKAPSSYTVISHRNNVLKSPIQASQNNTKGLKNLSTRERSNSKSPGRNNLAIPKQSQYNNGQEKAKSKSPLRQNTTTSIVKSAMRDDISISSVNMSRFDLENEEADKFTQSNQESQRRIAIPGDLAKIAQTLGIAKHNRNQCQLIEQIFNQDKNVCKFMLNQSGKNIFYQTLALLDDNLPNHFIVVVTTQFMTLRSKMNKQVSWACINSMMGVDTLVQVQNLLMERKIKLLFIQQEYLLQEQYRFMKDQIKMIIYEDQTDKITEINEIYNIQRYQLFNTTGFKTLEQVNQLCERFSLLNADESINLYGFDFSNINWTFESDKEKSFINFIRKNNLKKVIMFIDKSKKIDEVVSAFNQKGLKMQAFSSQKQDQIQQLFAKDQFEILCCYNGQYVPRQIKQLVQYYIHYHIPRSITSYLNDMNGFQYYHVQKGFLYEKFACGFLTELDFFEIRSAMVQDLTEKKLIQTVLKTLNSNGTEGSSNKKKAESSQSDDFFFNVVLDETEIKIQEHYNNLMKDEDGYAMDFDQEANVKQIQITKFINENCLKREVLIKILSYIAADQVQIMPYQGTVKMIQKNQLANNKIVNTILKNNQNKTTITFSILDLATELQMTSQELNRSLKKLNAEKKLQYEVKEEIALLTIKPNIEQIFEKLFEQIRFQEEKQINDLDTMYLCAKLTCNLTLEQVFKYQKYKDMNKNSSQQEEGVVSLKSLLEKYLNEQKGNEMSDIFNTNDKSKLPFISLKSQREKSNLLKDIQNLVPRIQKSKLNLVDFQLNRDFSLMDFESQSRFVSLILQGIDGKNINEFKPALQFKKYFKYDYFDLLQISFEYLQQFYTSLLQSETSKKIKI